MAASAYRTLLYDDTCNGFGSNKFVSIFQFLVIGIECNEEFRNLDRDIEGSAKRWKKFIESECPEKEKFPQEWKNKTSLQKLCMLRAFRPDRMTYAIR